MSEFFWMVVGALLLYGFLCYKAGTLTQKLRTVEGDASSWLTKLRALAQSIEAKIHGGAAPTVPVAPAPAVAAKVYKPLADAQLQALLNSKPLAK